MEEIKNETAAAASENEELTKLEKDLKKKKRSVRGYQFLILRIALLVLVLWVLFFQIIGLTHVPNDHMYPRLDAGDLVLFYRLDKDVRAQDIIVIEKETPESKGEKELYVLRVIAAAGDTVEIKDNRVIVNGNTLIEKNIFYTTQPYANYTQYPITLSDGQCFVLADKRVDGADSRYFGVVEKSEIVGTVITIMRRNNL